MSHSPSERRLLAHQATAAAREVVHEADRGGSRCALCAADLGHAYPRGAHVVILDGDCLASWRTIRPPTCASS
jgi:hypothetical protein